MFRENASAKKSDFMFWLHWWFVPFLLKAAPEFYFANRVTSNPKKGCLEFSEWVAILAVARAPHTSPR
jgi:hypothetical protein